jgi:undecaprenyl-diphosphatase
MERVQLLTRMTLYHALVLGLLQGITEFLPISSSGHLVLMQTYLGLQLEPSVLQHFDIVLHGGSLIAILLYFASTWKRILLHPFKKEGDGGPPMLVLLFVATIPLAVTGYLSADWIYANTQTPLFVAFGFIFTGAFLIVSGWYESRFAAKEACGWKQALGASIGQAIAVLPGFSRSGMTIASGRLMGLTASRATEFAFLLGAPALGGALLYTFLQGQNALHAIGWIYLLIGFTTSLLSSILVIHFFIHTIRKYGVWMWSAYLFVAAALIIGDSMWPFILEFPSILKQLDVRIVIGTLFIALLLESAPFTSFFVPGLRTLVVVTLFFHDDRNNLIALIPIGTAGLVLGHLLGYIPARQAREQVRWSENSETNLTKAHTFMKKWGIYAVFFGGWIAPIRPWVSVAAGLSSMRPLSYLLAMIFGSLALVTGVVTITTIIGQSIF